jgi:predicted permease
MALGIGANAAIFSVVYGVLLRPLPYHEAGRLALLYGEANFSGANRPVPVLPGAGDLENWQRTGTGAFAPAFYASDVQRLTTAANGAEVLDTAVVSGNFFSTVAGPFAAGRPLERGDDGLPRVVISFRLAQRLFGAATDAIGKPLDLTAAAYTVVGVVSPAFQFPEARVDAWMPLGFVRTVNPRCCGFRVIARLTGDTTIERARALADTIVQRPSSGPPPAGNPRAIAVSLRDSLVAAVRPALLVLFASVIVVLAVACGNLINLILARNAAREREFAVRRALGASAGDVASFLLAETALVAVGGGLCGLVVAQTSVTLLARSAATAIPRLDAIHIDAPVLIFTVVVAAISMLATAIVPAVRAAGVGDLRPSGNASTGSVRTRLQRGICAAQVALAMTLVIGALLLGRSLVRLVETDLGVSTDHVVTASMSMAFSGRPTDAQAIDRVDRVIEQIASRPGVRAVGAGTSLPPNASRFRVTLKRSGDAVNYQASLVPATPGYFSALQMRLVRGRFFTESDDLTSAPVMIMSQDTARRFFGDGDPIGRTMNLPQLRDGQTINAEMTLVGVVANVKFAGLAVPADDAVYRPFKQQAAPAPFVVVRTIGDPIVFAATLRREIAEADPRMVVSAVTTADDLVMNAAAQPRFRTTLFASLAALGAASAAVGLYSVVAYSVAQRTKEIGIRVALGATRSNVLVMVVGEGMRVAAAGIAGGIACALALSRVLQALLYGIEPTDTFSFLVAPAALATLTLAAAYVPARRAARVDPIGALRTD